MKHKWDGWTQGDILQIAVNIARSGDQDAARQWVRDYREWNGDAVPSREFVEMTASNLIWYAGHAGMEHIVKRVFGLDTPIFA